LNLIKTVDVCTQQFRDQEKEIPAWMFLAWKDQLMSCLLNENLYHVFESLISRMVEEYPQAMTPLIFSQLSYSKDIEDFSLNTLGKLRDSCQNYDVYETFVHHLNYLRLPWAVLKDLTEIIKNITKQSSSKNIALSRVQQEYKSFCSLYLTNADKKGSLFANLSKKKREIDRHVANLDTEKIDEIAGAIRSYHQKLRSRHEIKDFSPFLAQFHASNKNMFCEIPGQYTSFFKPCPSSHKYISSFSPEIAVFSSLRSPVLLTMIASNGKKSKFVVKSGEDLRLDQRIISLFEMCNVAIAQNVNQKNRNLQIKTYNIFPLSDNLGLIEFLDNTSPLSEFKSVGKRTDDIEQVLREIMKKMPIGYDAVCSSPSKEIVDNYEKSVRGCASDHVKCAMLKLSSGLQQFYLLRTNFCTSYSVVSIMQWILGIGDRHMGNYLICLKSGNIIPIDFGYSFGIAVTHAPNPELVQLRLTPQIRTLLGLNLNGLYRELMITVLKTLRDNSEILMSTLDIIVQEPVQDWLKYSRQKSKGLDIEEAMKDFAQGRIDVTKKKLEGGHPGAIMFIELRSNKNKDRKTPDSVKKLIKTDRIVSHEEELSCSEQVDILIDQSTDSNLLGRMYYGWSPHA